MKHLDIWFSITGQQVKCWPTPLTQEEFWAIPVLAQPTTSIKANSGVSVDTSANLSGREMLHPRIMSEMKGTGLVHTLEAGAALVSSILAVAGLQELSPAALAGLEDMAGQCHHFVLCCCQCRIIPAPSTGHEYRPVPKLHYS